MVSILDHQVDVLAAYLRRGEAGVADVADRLHERAHDRPGERFGKREARYLPQSPLPPVLWPYRCGRCRFWEEGEPGEPGHCHVVGRAGDPYGGEAIHARGWCGLWTPPAGEPAFAWLRERLRPDGASSVRGEYRPRLAAGDETRAGRGEMPVAGAAGDGGTRADGASSGAGDDGG